MSKRPGAPRLTPEGARRLTISISKEDLAFLLTIAPQPSKAIRQLVKERIRPMEPTITATLDAIRSKLTSADDTRNVNWQIGDILIALGLITDVLEAQERRHEQYINRIDMIL